MAKVALVNVPFQAAVASIAQTSVGPPMGLAYLASVLLSNGHDVRLIDANAHGWSFGDIARDLAHFQPDVVGTTAATPSIELAGELAALTKRLSAGREVAVIVGGAHTTALPMQTLTEFPAIDVVVTGEGEGLVCALVEAVTGGGSLEEIPSIAFRKSGNAVLNPKGAPIADLDTIPFPARHLLPNQLYRTIDSWPMTCMIAVRGCPARCVYCNVPELAGRQVRRRSPGNVVAEMEETLKRWRVSYFSFLDDTFTTSRRWVEDFCTTMTESGLNKRVSWSCLTRPDMADRDLLLRMKEAGLSRVEFGIESGSPRVLKFMRKGATLEQIRQAFAAAQSLSLLTMGFAMVNTPNETPEEMEMTLQEVLSINPDFLQLSYCTPYPGTFLYDYCRKHGLIDERPWSDYRFLKTPLIRNRHLSAEDIEARHREILRRFYLRPGKALRLAQIGLADSRTARSIFRSAVGGLRHLADRF